MPSGEPASPATASRPAGGSLRHRFLGAMRNTSRRNIYFSAMAVPGHLFMAASKAVVLLFSFSIFLAANMAFTLGLAAVKIFVVLTDRRANRRGTSSGDDIARTYRLTGLIVLVLSVAYVLSCLPLVYGTNSSGHYDRIVAIAIGVIAAIELAVSAHGVFASRKHNDLLMEAVKLSNLAASLILLVLAQTALLSLTTGTSVDPITQEPTMDPSRYNGLSGLVLGSLAALIGVYMLTRSRAYLMRDRSARRRSTVPRWWRPSAARWRPGPASEGKEPPGPEVG